MVEEVVVKDPLTEKMIESGAEFTVRLYSDYPIFTAAYWLYNEEFNRWRLVFASPEVEINGKRKIYEKLHEFLRRFGDGSLPFSLFDISVVEDKDRIVKALRKLIRFKRGEKVQGVRLTRSPVNGEYIDDLYLYELAKRSHKKSPGGPNKP